MLAVFGVTSLHTADTDGFSLTRFRELVPMLPGLYPSWNMVDMENIESRAQRWGKRIGAVGVLLWIYNRIASQGIVIKNDCHVEWKSNRIYHVIANAVLSEPYFDLFISSFFFCFCLLLEIQFTPTNRTFVMTHSPIASHHYKYYWQNYCLFIDI